MLTSKGKYALKAMVHLAGKPASAMTQGADIARANAISKKFLDAILTDLRRAGFIYSKKGKGGGYALIRPPREICVGAIVRAVDGPLAPIPCASVTAFRPCQDCADLAEDLRGEADDGGGAQRHRQRARPHHVGRNAFVRGGQYRAMMYHI